MIRRGFAIIVCCSYWVKLQLCMIKVELATQNIVSAPPYCYTSLPDVLSTGTCATGSGGRSSTYSRMWWCFWATFWTRVASPVQRSINDTCAGSGASSVRPGTSRYSRAACRARCVALRLSGVLWVRGGGCCDSGGVLWLVDFP